MVMLKLRYIVCQRSKGREYFYFRRGKLYVPMPNPITDNARFQAKYDRLLKSADALPVEPTVPGSFSALAQDYIASAAYKGISKRSQEEYRRHLDAMRKDWGPLPVNRLTRRGVLAYKATLAETPRTAHMAMQVLRRLLNFAIDIGQLATNPAVRTGKPKSEQFKPWPDEAVAAFREKNAANETMLLALDLGLYTGQRRGDVIRMTMREYDGRRINIVQHKTGERLSIPVHPELKARIDGLRDRRFMLLTTPTGKQFTPTHFSHLFKEAVDAAGLVGLSFHGLRVTAAVKLAEAGCSDSEIQAVLGHRTVAMAAYYRRQADKQRHADAAILKLERNAGKV